jgi:hypothetical protein
MRPKKSLNNIINQKIFSHPRFDAVVAVATVETYLQHAALDPDLDVEEGLREVGNIISKIRDANEMEFSIHFEGHTVQKEFILEGLNSEIRMLVDDLLGPKMLNLINLNCTNDIFLEILMGNIRNSIVSLQTWYRKVEQCRTSLLTRRLNMLKCDYVSNQHEIFQLESALTEMREDDLRLKIHNMKIFEHLHNERPSPLFLNLIKRNNETSLSGICDDNGVPFNTEEERNEHIVKSYEKIYLTRAGEDKINYENCINQFLGPEIVNSSIVQGSILTNEERSLLDSPLSLDELDKSMENANMKSAPGQDGYSNVLLKRIWKFIRIPLLNYANHCFITGSLTQNFRSAVIKLIPKKGDLHLLKNWRPISLLSNVYKLLSRTFSARLNKINNRICSRAQKGYNNVRYTQEVLINVCETIQYCKQSGTRAGVVAIDMAKAFDTLDHKFINQVYKFFGLGDNIIRWLTLFGNNRQACIQINNNLCSRYFKLGRGRPQGDNLSPITFNFCEQILIFRLELDPLVAKIPRQHLRVVNASDPFRFESNRETANNESLADDNTVLTLLQEESLRTIKNALIEFGDISGLCCNYDKTVILPVFEPTDHENNFISNLGFRTVATVKLLGMDITRNFEDVGNNFVSIKEKILKLIRFWERFRLSLPGRISIAKTFLVSQLNYLGGVFRPPAVVLAEIQSLINNFIKKNLNISRERITRSVEFGGCGFFLLEDFLAAQRCAWIFRAHKATIDNWRFDLFVGAPDNNILAVRAIDFDKNINPVLFELAENYENFYSAYSNIDSNYKKAQVFSNKFFCQAESGDLCLDVQFFGRRFYTENRNNLRKLIFSDCFRGGTFKPLEEWRADGLPLTLNTWLRMRNAIVKKKNSLKNSSLNETSSDIADFVAKIKKGSRKVRNVLDRCREKKLTLNNQLFFTSFKNITNFTPTLDTYLKNWVGLWKLNSLSNDLKFFIFQCRFNYLPTNNRLHAYRPEIDPRCTFCRINDDSTDARDSFVHFFYNCPTTTSLLKELSKKLTSHLMTTLTLVTFIGTVSMTKTTCV